MVRSVQTLIALALLVTIASTLRVYPHQLAYFNEAAGGPENGCRHLLESNLDWGQDLWLVREWATSRNIRPCQIRLLPATFCPVRHLVIGDTSCETFPAWEILSRQMVSEAEHFGDFDDTALASAERIGHTMWAIPLANSDE